MRDIDILLHYAAKDNNFNLVKDVVERGADVHVRYRVNDSTPLMEAARSGHDGIVAYLLSKGSDVNATDDEGATPLIYASYKDNEGIVEMLLEQGADINVQKRKDKDSVFYTGRNALLTAARERNYNVAKYLIEHNANVTMTDHDEMTALHYAAADERLDIIRCLIARGADINAKDKCGGTPLYYVICRGRSDIVHYLVNIGADIHVITNTGETILHAAIMGAHQTDEENAIGIAEYLLKCGVDALRKDVYGHTASDLAELWRFQKMKQCIEKSQNCYKT